MGRAPCCDKANVKRGPWSPEEDATLRNYLLQHGTAGNWISLPQRAGLKRCGKSCRLRWLNYLRPDIKHGAFTEEEDNIIISLFYKMGSRWSVIAANLPGRTDNDVKNHWNTKLKKKLFGGTNNTTVINKFNTCSSIPKIHVPLTYAHNNTNILFNNHNHNHNHNHPSVFKASPSSPPTTPTYVDNLFNHLYLPIPSFSSLLAQCTAPTSSPMSLFPNFTSLSLSSSSSSPSIHLERPYDNNSNLDPIPSPSSSWYPLHQTSSGGPVTDKVGPPEEAPSVSGSSSAVYGPSLDQDDPFLAELGFGLMIQEVMMNPATTCSYGDQEDVKPHHVHGQSVIN